MYKQRRRSWKASKFYTVCSFTSACMRACGAALCAVDVCWGLIYTRPCMFQMARRAVAAYQHRNMILIQCHNTYCTRLLTHTHAHTHTHTETSRMRERDAQCATTSQMPSISCNKAVHTTGSSTLKGEEGVLISQTATSATSIFPFLCSL